MTLAVITFLYKQPPEWRAIKREPYTAMHVNAWARAVKKNLTIPHRRICITDQPEGITECETMPVWDPITVGGQQSCYRKIKAFDGDFQRSLGSKILCMDLDVAFLRNFDELITDDDFRIMRGSANRKGQLCAWYNGSMWLCKAGAREFFWKEFTPEKAERMRAELIMPGLNKRVTGSDQAWFSCISPNEKVYAPQDGVLQFHMYRRHTLMEAQRIFREGKLVFFAGGRKPWSRLLRQTHPQLYSAWTQYTR
jgi:hypothetical protein